MAGRRTRRAARIAAGRAPVGLAVTGFAVAFSLLQGQPAEQEVAALKQAGIDQKIGEAVPLDLVFRNEAGARTPLASYFEKGKPVLLTLVYYECPMLCNEVLNGVLRASRAMEFTAGREFDIVTVSINPAEIPEQALEKKNAMLNSLGRPVAESGWHFLTGEEKDIRSLADAVGFRFTYNPRTELFAHSAAIILLTPRGRISHYFYGVEYAPRDLRLAVIEAADEKLGTMSDQVLLYCFQYDPRTGQYSLLIMRVIRVLGLLTVAALVGLMIFLRWNHSAVSTGSSAAAGSLAVPGGDQEG